MRTWPMSLRRLFGLSSARRPAAARMLTLAAHDGSDEPSAYQSLVYPLQVAPPIAGAACQGWTF